MIRVWGIAGLTVRHAMRARFLQSMVAILLLAVGGLFATATADGTTVGQVRILVTYGVGLSVAILGAGTLWTAAASISQEVQNRRLHLVSIKPVFPAQIWLGRWLGLMLVNAALLALVGGLLVAGIGWKIAARGLSAEERRILRDEVLVARRRFGCPPKSVEQDAHAEYERILAAGGLPPDADHSRLISDIRNRLLARAYTVPPGQSMEWIFAVPRHAPRQAAIWVRFRFVNWLRDAKPVKGTWSVGRGNRVTFTASTLTSLEGEHLLSVPLPALFPAETDPASAGERVTVRFTNGEESRTEPVVFHAESGVELLVRQGTFGANLARGLTVALFALGLIAALGLTAGTVLSFPVATFAGVSILVMVMLSHYYVVLSAPRLACAGHQHGTESGTGPSAWRTASERFVRASAAVVEPALQFDPVTALSGGLLVSWGRVAWAGMVLGGLYSGALGVAGAVLLGRRELGLPAGGAT